MNEYEDTTDTENVTDGETAAAPRDGSSATDLSETSPGALTSSKRATDTAARTSNGRGNLVGLARLRFDADVAAVSKVAAPHRNPLADLYKNPLADLYKNPVLEQTERIAAMTRPLKIPAFEGLAATGVARHFVQQSSAVDELVKSLTSVSHFASLTAKTSLANSIPPSSMALAKLGGLTATGRFDALQDLGRIAEKFSAAGLTPTLLGSLRANAGIAELASNIVPKNWSTEFAARLVTGAEVGRLAAWAEQLNKQAETREWLLLASAAATPAGPLLSARPLAAYDRFLGGVLSPVPAQVEDEEGDGRDPDDVHSPVGLGVLHGHAVDGLVARDALLRPLTGDDLDAVLEVVETKVIEPWRSARDGVGEHLHARLSTIDPKLAELFCGGWETLATQGAGYIEAACHLILETLQRTLTATAPDDAVRAWAEQNGIPVKEITSNGRVTRRARLRYLYAGRKGERRLVVAELEALDASVEEVVSRLNAGKHASAADLASVRANFATAEAMLLRILG
jgi:hypothetical protein